MTVCKQEAGCLSWPNPVPRACRIPGEPRVFSPHWKGTEPGLWYQCRVEGNESSDEARPTCQQCRQAQQQTQRHEAESHASPRDLPRIWLPWKVMGLPNLNDLIKKISHMCAQHLASLLTPDSLRATAKIIIPHGGMRMKMQIPRLLSRPEKP